MRELMPMLLTLMLLTPRKSTARQQRARTMVKLTALNREEKLGE